MPDMDTADLDRLLQRTLADGWLQTAERRALIDWIAKHAPDERSRALARSRAFALAKSRVAANADQTIDWLEDIIKVMREAWLLVASSTHDNNFPS